MLELLFFNLLIGYGIFLGIWLTRNRRFEALRDPEAKMIRNTIRSVIQNTYVT